jgi:hypothetical protein
MSFKQISDLLEVPVSTTANIKPYKLDVIPFMVMKIIIKVAEKKNRSVCF